jgi:hypothetical protein
MAENLTMKGPIPLAGSVEATGAERLSDSKANGRPSCGQRFPRSRARAAFTFMASCSFVTRTLCPEFDSARIS